VQYSLASSCAKDCVELTRGRFLRKERCRPHVCFLGAPAATRRCLVVFYIEEKEEEQKKRRNRHLSADFRAHVLTLHTLSLGRRLGSLLAVRRILLYTCVPHTSLEVMYMARGRPPVCIHCGSHRSISKGKRRTKTLGDRRLRVCKDCGRKFTPRHQKPLATSQHHARNA
jgi:hypothetical protein